VERDGRLVRVGVGRERDERALVDLRQHKLGRQNRQRANRAQRARCASPSANRAPCSPC
jgi:hypothetical protein